MPLYILPNVFTDDQPTMFLLPEGIPELLLKLTGFIAESERTGRRYLIKLLGNDPVARTLPVYLLNEHSSSQHVAELGEKILAGETFGLISDAGMPGVADPGHELIYYLRRKGETRIFVIPGPCSIFLALIASGLPGQKFAFHGYVPKEKEMRKNKMCQLERESKREGVTQVFIEAPYRNEALIKELIDTLQEDTELSVVTQITLPDEQVMTFPVKKWKRLERASFDKKPSIFLFHAQEKKR